jgi:hypothetical protein
MWVGVGQVAKAEADDRVVAKPVELIDAGAIRNEDERRRRRARGIDTTLFRVFPLLLLRERGLGARRGREIGAGTEHEDECGGDHRSARQVE